MLENKWWFRLIKALYILLFIGVFVGGCWIWWDSKPYAIIDTEKSYVLCDRDAASNLVYYLDKNDWYEWGRKPDEGIYTLSYYNDLDVKRVCARPINPETGEPYSYPVAWESSSYPSKNYVLTAIYKTEGDISDWIWSLVNFLFWLVIISISIRELFYYIATGKTMFKNIYYYQTQD